LSFVLYGKEGKEWRVARAVTERLTVFLAFRLNPYQNRTGTNHVKSGSTTIIQRGLFSFKNKAGTSNRFFNNEQPCTLWNLIGSRFSFHIYTLYSFFYLFTILLCFIGYSYIIIRSVYKIQPPSLPLQSYPSNFCSINWAGGGEESKRAFPLGLKDKG